MWADTVTTHWRLFSPICVLTLSNCMFMDDWEVYLLWEARECSPQPLVLCASQRSMPCHWHRGNMQFLTGRQGCRMMCMLDSDPLYYRTQQQWWTRQHYIRWEWSFCVHVCIFACKCQSLLKRCLLYGQGLFKSADLPTEQSSYLECDSYSHLH